MEFKSTYQTITESKVFKNFKQEYPNSELVAGFFILDFINNANQKSLDYKINEKIFTFSLNENNEITFKEDKLIKNSQFPELKKISSETQLDLNEIPSLVEKAALENNIQNNIQKIIAILQIHDNQQVWNLTCIFDSFTIVNILINADTKEIIKFQKKNMADFIKKA